MYITTIEGKKYYVVNGVVYTNYADALEALKASREN